MTRFKWLKVQWPVTIQALGKRLKEKSFEKNGRHGFVIDRIREDSLEGRYVEKVEYTETITDPFGVEITFDRVEFRQSTFRVSNVGCGLELRDPPRTTQALMNQLSEVLDFRISITSQEFDVLEWASNFQRVAGVSAIVDSLQINSLMLSQGISARVVVKGDKDVRESAAALACNRPFVLEKIQLRLPSPLCGTLILTNSGSVTINADDPAEIILDSVRNAIPELHR